MMIDPFMIFGAAMGACIFFVLKCIILLWNMSKKKSDEAAYQVLKSRLGVNIESLKVTAFAAVVCSGRIVPNSAGMDTVSIATALIIAYEILSTIRK